MSIENTQKVLEYYAKIVGAQTVNPVLIFLLLKDLREMVDVEDLDWLDLLGRVNNTYQRHIKFVHPREKKNG
jgi:hypothetical protein